MGQIGVKTIVLGRNVKKEGIKKYIQNNLLDCDSELIIETVVGRQTGTVPIQVYENVFPSKEKAEDFLDYKEGQSLFAVKFMASNDLMQDEPNNKKILLFEEKILKIREKIDNKVKEESLKVKGKTLSCSNCGSKINADFLIWNKYSPIRYSLDENLRNKYELDCNSYYAFEETPERIHLNCPVCQKGNLLSQNFITYVEKEKTKLIDILNNFYTFRTKKEKEEYWLICGRLRANS